MSKRKTWVQNFVEEQGDCEEFVTESLLLRINGEIRHRMCACGMTQTDLAERMSVRQAYISKLLNYNPNLTIASLAKIARALGCEWSDFKLQEAGYLEQPCPASLVQFEFERDQWSIRSSTTGEKKKNESFALAS